MESKKLDIKKLRLLKIELSDDEFKAMKSAVSKTGLKQQFWLRLAVLDLIGDGADSGSSHRSLKISENSGVSR